MGWIFTQVQKGQAGEYLKKTMTWDNEHSKGELLKGAFVNWHEYYAAVKITKKDSNKTYTIAVICLIQYAPKDYYNFGYKDLEESMGVYKNNCPASILKLLTPCEEIYDKDSNSYKYSKNWRIACWENIFRNNDANRLKNNSVIKFDKPIHFTNNEDVDTFLVKKKGRSTKFHKYYLETKSYSPYNYYNISKNILKNYKVVGFAA